MARKNTIDSYGSTAKTLHWLIFAAIAFNITSGLTMGELPRGNLQNLLYLLHKSTGVTILGLAILRFIWKLMNVAPALPATLSPVEKMAAHVSHWVLYALMLAVPLSGYVFTMAGGFGFDWYGLFRFPDLVGRDKGLADKAAWTHALLAWALLGMVTLHVAAALRHHFMLKDNTLTRMLPGR